MVPGVATVAHNHSHAAGADLRNAETRLVSEHEDAQSRHETAATIASFAAAAVRGPSGVKTESGEADLTTKTSSSGPDRPVAASSLMDTSPGVGGASLALEEQNARNYQSIFSTIGFGIDSRSVVNGQTVESDATDAALKAVRDAMDRGVFRLPSSGSSGNNLRLHLKLGVPARNTSSPGLRSGVVCPMRVDTRKVLELLPKGVTVLPVEVVVGGLWAQSSHQNTCTAVACIEVRDHPSTAIVDTSMVSAVHRAPVESPTSVATSTSASRPEGIASPPASWAEVERPIADQPLPSGLVKMPSSSHNRPHVSRSTSIEMLAAISAEIHAQQPKTEDERKDDDSATGPVAYNYRKLPPGVTPKNNRRLFVKHVYRDHSQELPRSDELDLLGPNAENKTRTPNAAFPLKLHETLRQIELDGFSNIIGWLPHGRSFKIFDQLEFVETVLPRYFVMTKKSSFLRQLNLYGFNRLSGDGPDQGSYYHEKFLRGLKFLTRRMHRQKVNGNGIRAAGNPDDEPKLSLYPACPPLKVGEQPPKEMDSFEQKEATEKTNGGGSVVNSSKGNSRPSLALIQDPSILKGPAGHPVSFPLKLQRILDRLEADGNTDIISWLPHGRAFLVHDSTRFVNELMPVYFNQSKYSSFQRQLHMYNFQRITSPGPDKGAYHHPDFLRGHPQLALKMKRTRVNGKGTRRPGNPESEPDFHRKEFLPSIAFGTKVDVPSDQPTAVKSEYADGDRSVTSDDDSGSGNES